jgi:hypothetical protein
MVPSRSNRAIGKLILPKKVSVSDKGRLFGKNLTIVYGFVDDSIAKLEDKAQIV